MTMMFKPGRERYVPLFVGGDIVAQSILNEFVPFLIENGFTPVIYLPAYNPVKGAVSASVSPARHTFKKASKASKSMVLPDNPEIARFLKLERKILDEAVFPFLKQESCPDAKMMTPHQLAQKYGLTIKDVTNVNAPEFLDEIRSLKAKGLAGALSIRCFQIFKKPIIDLIKASNDPAHLDPETLGPGEPFFMNLHPGRLPQYRGVFSTLRAMADFARAASLYYFGATLHDVNTGIDTGLTYKMKGLPIKSDESLYAHNLRLVLVATKLLHEFVSEWQGLSASTNEMKEGIPLHQQISHAGDKAEYFTNPTNGEMDEMKAMGIRLASVDEVKTALIERYSVPGSDHAKRLEKVMDRWIADQGIDPGQDYAGPARTVAAFDRGPSVRSARRVVCGRPPVNDPGKPPTGTTGGRIALRV
ncbi:MAG: hypothetical protein H6865_01155 [Rhodospirillales bacterium]|nr:hypothetical protein [Alphaproteobacteria bacterium]MCB9986234.1 hypothetical protein [Rhodospirillales bacterium]USO07211.1 MAG: hypothetical protein H6866_07215 [Rhodospirillales bacterium]